MGRLRDKEKGGGEQVGGAWDQQEMKMEGRERYWGKDVRCASKGWGRRDSKQECRESSGLTQG